MFGTRRGIYQLGGGCPFKRIFTSAHLPGQNLGDIHFTSHSLCIFCFFSLAPRDLCRAFLLSVSLLLYPPGVISELDSYPFALPALIFSHAAWLTGSCSARTELLITGTPHHHPLHTLLHTQRCVAVWSRGKCKSFFLFSLFSSDSCGLGLPWQRLPEELISGGVVGHPHIYFKQFSLPLDTHAHKHTHTQHNKEVSRLVLSLLYTYFKSTHWGVCHRWLKSRVDSMVEFLGWNRCCYFNLMELHNWFQIIKLKGNIFYWANVIPYNNMYETKIQHCIKQYNLIPYNLITSLMNLIQYVAQFYLIWWIMIRYYMIRYTTISYWSTCTVQHSFIVSVGEFCLGLQVRHSVFWLHRRNNISNTANVIT